MSCCPVPPQNPTQPEIYGNQMHYNGVGGNTEGGRLRRLMKFTNNGVTSFAETVTDSCRVCKPPQEEQPPITKTESSRIHDIMVRCGTGTQSGYVTQDRVQELLARTQRGRQFGSEDQRIQALIQNTEICNTFPDDPRQRFQNQLQTSLGNLEYIGPGVSNIVMFLDGSRLDTIEFLPGTSNLFRWYSCAGNSNVYGYANSSLNPIQYNATEKGLYVNNSNNASPAPSVASCIPFSSNILPSSNFTLFTVSKLTPITDTVTFHGLWDNTNPGVQAGRMWISGGEYINAQQPNGLPETVRYIPNPNPYTASKECFAVTSDNTRDTFYNNGSVIGTSGTPMNYIQANSNYFPALGGPYQTNDARWATGYIQQFVLFNTALSSNDVATITSALLNDTSVLFARPTLQSNVYVGSSLVPIVCPPLPPPPAPPARTCVLTKNEKY